MSEFEARQVRAQSSDLIQSTAPDRAAPQPTRAASQEVGNQAAQRFAQSCPLRLPSPALCPFGGICHACPLRAQAKLTVTEPGDRYEQEADRVAEQVMQMPEPRLQRQIAPEEEEEGEETLQAKPLAEQITPLIQRQVDPKDDEDEEGPIQVKLVESAQVQRQEEEPEEEEEEPIQTKLLESTQVQRQAEDEEEEEEEEEEGPIQAKSVYGWASGASLSQETPSLLPRGGGRPLSGRERNFFEPRFGRNLSRVRLHTDGQAARAAGAIHARAFTVGGDVVFGAGQYRPETDAGKRLLAHELAHVVQQGKAVRTAAGHDAGGVVQGVRRETGRGTQPATAEVSVRPVAAGTTTLVQRNNYGPVCSTGARDPCRQARCPTNHSTSVPADLRRGIGYVDQAIAALGRSPLASDTITALDWFFRDHSADTVRTLRERLRCIRGCLNDTLTNNRYACDPDSSALAYVCLGNVPFCGHRQVKICLTDNHFDDSERGRAETVIHECAHREGMSVGSSPDIYDHEPRYMHMDTDQALGNADNYALFAGSVAEGIPLSVLMRVGLGGAAAFPLQGSPTWVARLDMDFEFQHPVLTILNPTLGLHMAVVGAPDPGTGATALTPGTQPSASALFSLVGGVRIGLPRAGEQGAGYVSFFGGPALNVGAGQVRAGAEAGVGIGYRWRFLDVSVGMRYQHAPLQPPGAEHMIQVGGMVSFTPAILR